MVRQIQSLHGWFERSTVSLLFIVRDAQWFHINCNIISQFLFQDGQLLHDVLGLAHCGYLHSLRLHLQSCGAVVRIKLILCKNCGHFAQHFRIINSNYEISLDWWHQFLSQVHEEQGAVWHQTHHHCLQLVPDCFQLLGLFRGLEVWLCWVDKTGICLKV